MRLFSVSFAAVVLAFGLTLPLPLASSVPFGNEVGVAMGSPNGSASVCQLAVFVNSVFVLGLEDGLGLVTIPHADPLSIRLPALNPTALTSADCTIEVGRLRVVDNREGSDRATIVTGPAPLFPLPAGPDLNDWRITFSGAPADVALCQSVVILNSVIVGGGTVGLPTGRISRPIVVSTAIEPDSADATRCRVSVGASDAVAA